MATNISTNKKRQSGRQINEVQKQALLDYLDNHLWLARNQFSHINGKEKQTEKWEEISNILNALGGAEKSADKWKKCWEDWR